MKISKVILIFLIIYLIFLFYQNYSKFLPKNNAKIEDWKADSQSEYRINLPDDIYQVITVGNFKREDFNDILNTKRFGYYDQIYINSVYGNQALGKLPGIYNVKTTFMDEVNAYPK